LWKIKVNNDAVQLNSLTPVVLMDRYIGYRGFRSLAFFGGSSNNVYAIDTDLARIEWQTRLALPAPPSGPRACPGGLTANVTRPTVATYPSADVVGGGLGGRGGPAHSGVGAPGEGAITISAALAAAAAAGPGRAPNPRARAVIYALAGDGTLRSLYISNGLESEPPMKFLPPDANAQGLIVVDGIAFAVAQNCNNASGGVFSLDLASKKVSMWQPAAGIVAGTEGPAFGPDGTVYATTSIGELVALEPKTLTAKGTYSTGGPAFSSSPVVFPNKGRTLIAAATNNGTIQLIDGSSLNALFKTPPVSVAESSSISLATWQAPGGDRWLLSQTRGAPPLASGFSEANGSVTNGAIAAWRLVDQNEAVSLEPRWLSRDLISPLPPMIINGVVFAVSSGEFRSNDNTLSAAQIAQRSAPAVLYALDGSTGKIVWDSGKTITSFVHSGGVSGGAGQVYLTTYDQNLYVFGFPIEH
jgi:outer membrane protein assembly factor BamB